MQRRLVLAILIAVSGGLIIGNVLTRDGMSCNEWQQEYARVADEGRGGVFDFINEGPTAQRLQELEEERPEGCATPDA